MILVIDDQPIFRALFSSALELGNLESETASKGSEGIKRILDERPELVLLDYTLPDMDADEFIRWLRFDFLEEPIPLIVSLTHINERILRVLRHFKADGHFLKTVYSPADLRRQVNKVLGRVTVDEHLEEITRRQVLVEPVIERLQRKATAELQEKYRAKLLA